MSSEDPLLTGEIAAGLIQGIQSQNVGTSMKHYLANNQETARIVANSVIDERALREIYLAGYETAIKKAQPWTLMCSYNRINGTYASDNTVSPAAWASCLPSSSSHPCVSALSSLRFPSASKVSPSALCPQLLSLWRSWASAA